LKAEKALEFLLDKLDVLRGLFNGVDQCSRPGGDDSTASCGGEPSSVWRRNLDQQQEAVLRCDDGGERSLELVPAWNNWEIHCCSKQH
jgi:hypothetical protein